jgi:hypothetical protein
MTKRIFLFIKLKRVLVSTKLASEKSHKNTINRIKPTQKAKWGKLSITKIKFI